MPRRRHRGALQEGGNGSGREGATEGEGESEREGEVQPEGGNASAAGRRQHVSCPAMDVDLMNVRIGMRCKRGRHWRTAAFDPSRGAWVEDRQLPGTIIGFSDADARLVGANAIDRNEYNSFSVEDGKVTAGPAWCAVRWDADSRESIYPIGARGPLGKWWVGPLPRGVFVGYGDKPCFSLFIDTGAESTVTGANPPIHPNVQRSLAAAPRSALTAIGGGANIRGVSPNAAHAAQLAAKDEELQRAQEQEQAVKRFLHQSKLHFTIDTLVEEFKKFNPGAVAAVPAPAAAAAVAAAGCTVTDQEKKVEKRECKPPSL